MRTFSTCCSLLMCCKPVKLHISLWVSAQQCMVCTHNFPTDSVILHPPVVSPLRLFHALIRTCLISLKTCPIFVTLVNLWYHRTIIRTGITCKKTPYYLCESTCRWLKKLKFAIVKKVKIFCSYVKYFWILAGVRKCRNSDWSM